MQFFLKINIIETKQIHGKNAITFLLLMDVQFLHLTVDVHLLFFNVRDIADSLFIHVLKFLSLQLECIFVDLGS